MSEPVGKVMVMRALSAGGAYYLTNRVGGVTLDSELYLPYILSVGDDTRIGNFGEGNQVGNCHVVLMNGEDHLHGHYVFDVTRAWNNQRCEIRICDPTTDTAWADCEPYTQGLIKNATFGVSACEFDVDDADYRDDTTLPRYTAEEFVAARTGSAITTSDIPKDSQGKRIPLSVGNLNDSRAGVFAKGLTTSGKVGMQEIVFSSRPVTYLPFIGIWEPGTKQFFRAKDTYLDGPEYLTQASGARAIFNGPSSVKLAEAITSTTGLDNFTVTNSDALRWVDEDELTDWPDRPELLSTNLISVDQELMMLVAKPSDVATPATIWVERGYNGTTPVAHASGSTVYQSSTFAARNLLVFFERFVPAIISNQFYGDSEGGDNTPENIITSGSFANLLDGSASSLTLQRYIVDSGIEEAGWSTRVNFDLRFPSFDSTRTVLRSYFALDATLRSIWTVTITGSPQFNFLSPYTFQALSLADPSYQSTYDEEVMNGLERSKRAQLAVAYGPRIVSGDIIKSYASFDSVVRDQYATTLYPLSGVDVSEFYDLYTGECISLSTLNDLNKKFKFQWAATAHPIVFAADSVEVEATLTATIRNIGVWVEFIVDFTKESICAPLLGPEASVTAAAVVGQLPSPLAYLPTEVLAMLLVDEMGYELRDFEVATWSAVRDYEYNALVYAVSPQVAFSYGVDEESRGWDLCQEVAAHALLSLVRADNGQIYPVNMHRLQSTDATYGYASITAFAISVDDVIVSGGSRMLSIVQTGTDRLRNDITVKYKRNNSTGDYQASYTVPDTYTLPESGKTLAEARNTYYRGKRTEALVIESPYLYNAAAAQRLAEWHANDKAEVFLWATLTVDYEHYTFRNGLVRQYRIGDVVYLDGSHSGVVLDSTHLWVVREVVKKDQGREVELHCKSIEPISEFTSTAVDPNTTEYNSVSLLVDTMTNTVDPGEDAQYGKI